MSSTRPPDATPVCPRCSASLFGARALARSAPQDTGDLRPKGRAPNGAAERHAKWPDRSLRKHSCLPPSGLAWPNLAQSGSVWFTITDLALWRSGSFRLNVAQNASPRLLALWRSGSIRLSVAQNALPRFLALWRSGSFRLNVAQNASKWLTMAQNATPRALAIRLDPAQCCSECSKVAHLHTVRRLAAPAGETPSSRRSSVWAPLHRRNAATVCASSG